MREVFLKIFYNWLLNKGKDICGLKYIILQLALNKLSNP
jgi:hypothetical protein